MLPLILTELGLPSTVMVTCWPEWLVSVRVSLACNLSPLTVCLQCAWKETKSPHGMPTGVAVAVGVGEGVGVGVNVAVAVGVAVAVALGLAVGVGVGLGVDVAVSTNCDWLGMPLVKTVTSA